MLNSAILDVAIGIAFVFILVSTLCAAVREGIEAWLKTRSSYLEYAIRELLHDRGAKGLAKSFYEHPLIHGLYQGDYKAEPPQGGSDEWRKPPLMGKNLPSYIPARTFALALLDIAARGPATDAASGDPGLGKITFESLRRSVGNLQSPPVQRIVLNAFDVAERDLESVRQAIEAWYNDAMDRVSGWYKRTTQLIVLGIALVVVSALNLNTFVIVDHLYRDETLRDKVVTAAEGVRKDLSYEEASASLQNLALPIGWGRGWSANPKSDVGSFDSWNDLLAPVLGLLMTAMAAVLGAPFWFDMLNKVMVIRATVKPREKSQEEGSEDRATTSASKDRRAATGPAPTPPVQRPSAALRDSGEREPEHEHEHEHDEEEEHDGCDHEHDGGDPRDHSFTTDEELPPAQGGVA